MKFDYYIAHSVEDVLTRQKACEGKSAIISGGTDLLLDLQEGKKDAALLIDITRIPELQEITETDGCIRIGAAVTHAAVENSSLIKRGAPLLAAACRTVGSLQIRNIATLAGNVVSAQPAADAAVALTALNARIEIMDEHGITTIPILEAYAGVGKSAIDPSSQIVTAIMFDALGENQGSSFIRLEQRSSLALPMLNVASVVSLNPERDAFEWARIVMAPVGAGPVRADSAEKYVAGRPVSDEIITAAAQMAASGAKPRSSSLRGSKEYRLQVLPVLVKRALSNSIGQISKDQDQMQKEDGSR